MENNRNLTIGGIECYEKNGTVYLNLESVAKGLGFTYTDNRGNAAIRWNIINEYLTEFGLASCGYGQTLEYIPENVFYRLAFKAKSKMAEKFQAFVADEVIPSIRKNSVFMTCNAAERIIQDPDFIIQLANQVKVSGEKLEAAQKKIALDAPKVEYYDRAVARGDCLNFRDTAKVLKIGERALVRFLAVEGYIYHDRKNKIRPMAKYIDSNLFIMREYEDEISGKGGVQTLITVEGRTFFAKKL